jgi:hypothetical protein
LRYLLETIDMDKIITSLDKTKKHNNLLPNAFCWTKMGHEAGQSLNGIIARKDAERIFGDGLFFWGIGSSLGQKIWSFVKAVKTPAILFSPMKTRPKLADVKPDRIFAWTAYLDKSGRKHRVPMHALVTSRGTIGAKVKKSHYALVCRKKSSLVTDTWPKIDWQNLRNYQSSSKIGFSQVTSLVESKSKSKNDNSIYHVLFGARLVSPYFVTLVDPVEIPTALWAEVNHNWANDHFNAAGWNQWIKQQMPKFRKVEFSNGMHTTHTSIKAKATIKAKRPKTVIL